MCVRVRWPRQRQRRFNPHHHQGCSNPSPRRSTSPVSDVRPGANGTDMATNTARPECETGSDRDNQASHSNLLSIRDKARAARARVLALALSCKQRSRHFSRFIIARQCSFRSRLERLQPELVNPANEQPCPRHGAEPDVAANRHPGAVILSMEAQLIGRGILFGLSALFGSAALLTLVVAYRVGDFAAWRRLAVFAGVHAIISAVLASLASD
jgi:hypothetical protein